MSHSHWIVTTFLDGEDAETGLSLDRAAFLKRCDIIALIPKDIKQHIIHPGDNAQIHGFRELFLYLETTPTALELRRLVAGYFAASPELRSHLRSSPAASSSQCSNSAARSLPEMAAASPRGLSASFNTPMDMDSSVPGLSYVAAQMSLLNLGTDSADKKLHTFTFSSKSINPFKSRVKVDLMQTYLTYHNIENKCVAILGFNILVHCEKQRPRSLALRGALRRSSEEFHAVWPPPPSGDHSAPQEISRTRGETISGPTEHHYVIETRFDHTAPRHEFAMNIRPRKGQKRVPGIISIALAVTFPPERNPFVIDFAFSTGDRPRGQEALYTALFDGKEQFSKFRGVIP